MSTAQSDQAITVVPASGTPEPAMPTPPGLSRLPNEIKTMIAENLCPHCIELEPENPRPRAASKCGKLMTSLSALSKTCKVWQAMAQPILFHHVMFRRISDEDMPLARVCHFLRAIRDQPRLASYVKVAGLPWQWIFTREAGLHLQLDDQDAIQTGHLREIYKVAEDLGFTMVGLEMLMHWKDLAQGAVSRIIGELLPNVRVMSLWQGFRWPRTGIPDISHSPAFKMVTKLQLASDNHPGEDGFGEYLADLMTSMPELTHLELFWLKWMLGPSPALEVPHTSVKTLSLYRCEVTSETARSVLTSFPCLLNIRYWAGSRFDQEAHPDANNWNAEIKDVEDAFAQAFQSIPLSPMHDDQGRVCLDHFVVTTQGDLGVVLSRRFGADAPNLINASQEIGIFREWLFQQCHGLEGGHSPDGGLEYGHFLGL